MIVKCKKCEKKLKVNDEKLTEQGIKIRCPGCSTILLVKKPAKKAAEPIPEKPISVPAPEETPQPEEELDLSFEAPAEDEFTLPEEELDLSGEAPLEEEAPKEEEVPAEDEFNLPEEELDLSGEAPLEEEAPKEEEAPAEDEFTLPEEELDLSGVTPAEEEALKEEEAATEGESLLEGFDDGFATESTNEEAPKEEEAQEFQLDTNFDFSGEPEDAGEELKSNLDLAGDVGPAETAEETEEFDIGGPSLSLRDEPEQESPAPPPAEDTSLSSDIASEVGEQQAQPQPQAQAQRRNPIQKEVTGFGVAQRRSIPIIIPIILIIAVIGAGYFVYKKVTISRTDDVGELLIDGEQGSFVDNEKEGKLFVITGKVKNGYKVDRSFIMVKGTLFDNEENEVASKTVYAGNIPTSLETKKLSIDELDKLLNRKMGEELSNMNVSANSSIGFKIIFSGVDEEAVTHYKVIGAGSELAYSK